MRKFVGNERGSALVTAMFFIVGLTAIATVIVFVTGSERKTAHNEYTHQRSLNSSDAGSERGINWVMTEIPEPPLDADGTMMLQQQEYTSLTDAQSEHQEDNKYQIDVEFTRMRHALGSQEDMFVFVDYTIDSEGGAKDASSVIEVQATRWYTQGN